MAYNKDRVEYLLKLPKVPEVVEELIQANYGLVVKQLKKFGLLNNDDATSHGAEALYNAITTYDVNNKSSFSNYATICIYNRLGTYVRSLKTLLNTNTVSYDALMSETSTYSELLESKDTADGRLLQTVGIKSIYERIYFCLAKVKNPLHIKILNLWIDSSFTITHNEIAISLGCSQSYVTRVINSFRRTLKNKLEV